MKVLIFLEVSVKKWKVAHKNNGRDPLIATEIEKSVFLILKSFLKRSSWSQKVNPDLDKSTNTWESRRDIDKN